jgi:2-phosphoglycolate phosphatase
VAEAVLFDLDGTLVNSNEAVVWAVNTLLKRLGHSPVSPEKIISLIGVGIIPLLRKFIEQPEAHIPEYREIYKSGFQTRTSVYRGAKEVLSLLKTSGIKIGVVTNRSRELAQVIIDYFSLSKSVDVLVGQEGNTKLKPHPELILKACRILGVKPEDSIMVGDTEIDVETGKNAGSFTIKIDYGAKNELTKADAVVYTLPEILKFL